jgi:hypothetical protein
MAGELGDVALATLAQNFALEFADRAEVPLPHIEDLFCDLLSIRAQPVGQTALRDYWKPADIIEDWVSGEPPLDAPAHKRIAFLFHRELGFSVVDILTRLGDLTIQETTVKFIDLYAHKANCDRAAGLHLFRSRLITPETAARRTLGSYYSPARTVGRWTWSVYNRGTNAEARQEKTGLRLIFECGEPHETLAFVLTFLCRGEAEDVASRNWSQTLGAIAERTVFAYAAQRGAPVRTAETWFSPLRRTIRRCGLEETVWSKFCSSEADRAWTICDWRKKVLDRVRAGLPKRPGVVLFAYRYGLPWK